MALRAKGGAALPTGLVADLSDAQHVTLSGVTGTRSVPVVLRSTATGEERTVTLKPGVASTVTFTRGSPYPLPDLAAGRTTFPTFPLPAGMSSPSLAVDGSAATAWTPGPGGRMVVDLGAARAVKGVQVLWSSGVVRDASVAVSTDGLSYAEALGLATNGRVSSRDVTATTRYVALSIPDWKPGDATVLTFTVVAA
jgi:hypothetical protein